MRSLLTWLVLASSSALAPSALAQGTGCTGCARISSDTSAETDEGAGAPYGARSHRRLFCLGNAAYVDFYLNADEVTGSYDRTGCTQRPNYCVRAQCSFDVLITLSVFKNGTPTPNHPIGDLGVLRVEGTDGTGSIDLDDDPGDGGATINDLDLQAGELTSYSTTMTYSTQCDAEFGGRWKFGIDVLASGSGYHGCLRWTGVDDDIDGTETATDYPDPVESGAPYKVIKLKCRDCTSPQSGGATGGGE